MVLAARSGFLGRELQRFLVERDYDVVVLSPSPNPLELRGVVEPWDGRTLGRWQGSFWYRPG